MNLEHEVLHSEIGISFWGGIDPETGIIIDQTHPLHGKCVTDKILCIPSGRGSCTGSQVMLELILNGKSPFAIILRSADSILCTGAIVAEEFFSDECPRIPIIGAVGEEKFLELSTHLAMNVEEDSNGDVMIDCEDVNIATTKNLLKLKGQLGEVEKEMDESASVQTSEAFMMALRTVERVAAISSATKLIPITCAHIDAVTFIGRGGLKFAQKLAQIGGKVAVPTTLNSQSVDRRRWEELGVNSSLANNANAVGDAYLELGCDMSFTCAPYLLPSKPALGDNIMWGESNAVVYSNSVIGARTEKYADYFDICAAIIGKVPNIGVHLETNRVPKIVIDATSFIQNHVLDKLGSQSNDADIDSLFPVMGWLCGNLSDGQIPIILGFHTFPNITNDNLKAFCAAFGTTGTAPLFHMASVTPEAMDGDIINDFISACEGRRVEVTVDNVCDAYETLDSGKNEDGKIDLVALGNPHLSIDELERLVKLSNVDERPIKDDVKVIATLSRHIQEKGDKLGYVKKLENFGVQFINDTCWCMLLDEPIIPSNVDARILTNSGKYAHYGPGLTGRKLRFGSISQCMEAAKSGKMKSSNGFPQWLRSFSSRRLVRCAKRLK